MGADGMEMVLLNTMQEKDQEVLDMFSHRIHISIIQALKSPKSFSFLMQRPYKEAYLFFHQQVP